MDLNRKDLKKIMYSFNNISSRMMRVSYNEYNLVLKKFLSFLDNNELILGYIQLGYDSEFDAAKEYQEVVASNGDLQFDFGPTPEKESYQIYKIMKHIMETNSEIYITMMMQYPGLRKYQDIVKEFNDRVLLVLIHNIEEYLTKVGIDMGLDENTVWNVSGGQINVASGNATINATQNNGINMEQLDRLVQEIKSNLSGLSSENIETIIDSVDMIRDEIMTQEPKGNIINNGIKLLTPMITLANGIPVLAANIQKFIEYATLHIH